MHVFFSKNPIVGTFSKAPWVLFQESHCSAAMLVAQVFPELPCLILGQPILFQGCLDMSFKLSNNMVYSCLFSLAAMGLKQLASLATLRT